MQDIIDTFLIMLFAALLFAAPMFFHWSTDNPEQPIPSVGAEATSTTLNVATTTEFVATTTAATTTVNTPAELPAGVNCLEDCPLIVPEPVPAGEVEPQVRAFFKDVPVLIAIAECESNFRQHKYRGQVLKNEQGSSATGVMQIMASYHKERAENLGYDIYTTEGNLAYAYQLYREKGTQPWNASRHCWGTDRTA